MSFATNRVKSTKYNFLTFFPLALLLQFTRVINIFYLGNMIMQMIPEISTNAWYYTFGALSVMVGMGMIKELVNDLKRYYADKRENSLRVRKVISKDDIQFMKCCDVKVGDILAIKDNETVPADCILLSTDPSRKEG